MAPFLFILQYMKAQQRHHHLRHAEIRKPIIIAKHYLEYFYLVLGFPIQINLRNTRRPRAEHIIRTNKFPDLSNC